MVAQRADAQRIEREQQQQQQQRRSGRPEPSVMPQAFRNRDEARERDAWNRREAQRPWPPQPSGPLRHDALRGSHQSERQSVAHVSGAPVDAAAAERLRVLDAVLFADEHAQMVADPSQTELAQRQVAVAYVRQYERGRDWRKFALTAMYAARTPPKAAPIADEPLIQFEGPPTPLTPRPLWRAFTYLSAVSRQMGLSVAPQVPHVGELVAIEREAQVTQCEYPLVWLYAPANPGDRASAPLEIWWRDLPPTVDRATLAHAAFQWACVLGLVDLQRERLAGLGAQGDFLFVPSIHAQFARHLLPLVHAFARALLHFDAESGAPLCGAGPEAMGCLCDLVAATVNAPPIDHAQMTGELPPRRTPTAQPAPSAYPAYPPTYSRSSQTSGPLGQQASHQVAHPQEHRALTSAPLSVQQPAPTAQPAFQVSTPVTPQLPRTLGQTAAKLGPPLGAADLVEPAPLPSTGELTERLGGHMAGRPLPDGARAGRPDAIERLAAQHASQQATESGWGDEDGLDVLDETGEDDPGATREQRTPPSGGWR